MSRETPVPEMHPQRWGDPARAADLPESALGLVELAFGSRERASVSGRTTASRSCPSVAAPV